MGKLSRKNIKWFAKPEAHDYPAARSYLNLIYDNKRVDALVRALRQESTITYFKAKDIFRASGLSLLGVSNSHIQKNYKKIKKKEKMSPLLLVRDHITGKVIVADGYHRLCAVYHLDEDVVIPCKIV